MNTSNARHLSKISFEDYMAGEATAKRKHEYVDGDVYMMTGGSYAHNLISGNVFAELHTQFKGTPCRAMNSDNSVRVQTATRERGYYPDVLVTCGDDIRHGRYQDHPKIIFEVLSRSTRRIDEGEKREAYTSLDSLEVYVLLEQNSATAIIYRAAADGFERSILDGLDATLQFPEINASLSLAAIYADVDFNNPDQLREEELTYEVESSSDKRDACST